MGTIITLVVVVLIAWVATKVLAAMKNNEIIECASCSNRMTRGNFRRKGGCPKCGSDLIRRTGLQAGRS